MPLKTDTGTFGRSSNSLKPTMRWNRARARDLSLYMVNVSRFSTQAFARKVQRCWTGIGDMLWWDPTYGSIPSRQWIFSNFCATAWGFGWLRDSCESSKKNMPVTEGNRWTRFQDDTSFVWSSLLITYIHIINTYTILYCQVIWRRAACCYAYSHDHAFSWIGYIHSISWLIADFDQLQEAAVWIQQETLKSRKHPVWGTMLRLGLWQAAAVKPARKRCGYAWLCGFFMYLCWTCIVPKLNYRPKPERTLRKASQRARKHWKRTCFPGLSCFGTVLCSQHVRPLIVDDFCILDWPACLVLIRSWFG